MSRSRPRINQDANLWLQHPSKSIKQPSMRVDLFTVFLLEAKDDLDRNEVVWISWVWKDERRFCVDRDLSRVLREIRSESAEVQSQLMYIHSHLKYMRSSLLPIDFLLQDPILIYSNRSEQIQHTNIHRSESISDESDGDLLPRWSSGFCVRTEQACEYLLRGGCSVASRFFEPWYLQAETRLPHLLGH